MHKFNSESLNMESSSLIMHKNHTLITSMLSSSLRSEGGRSLAEGSAAGVEKGEKSRQERCQK